MTRASSCISESDIRNWHGRVYDQLGIQALEGLLEDPCRILNADESNFLLSPTTTHRKVVAVKGSKHINQVTKAEKEGLTVMATFRANGSPIKPFIIYPYERIPKKIVEKFPLPIRCLAVTKSGWMDSETFCLYLQCLHDELKDELDLPRQKGILFVDNHSSHKSLRACELSRALGIVIIMLYPNATFLIQPADVACFGPLKSYWRKEVTEIRAKNVDDDVNKLNFADVLLRAFSRLKPETISNGFRSTGLFPWDGSAINFSKLVSTKAAQATAECDSSTSHYELSDSDIMCQVANGSIKPDEGLEQLVQRGWIKPGNPEMSRYSGDNDDHFFVDTEDLSVTDLHEENYNLIQLDTILTPLPSSPPEYVDYEYLDDEDLLPQAESTHEPEERELLQLPPIPKRLNKRKIKRTPDIITSDENIDFLVSQQVEKRQKVVEKKDRATAREEKRKAKIAADIEKATKASDKARLRLEKLQKKN